MDALVFAELCEHLTDHLQKDEAKQNGTSSELLPFPLDKMTDEGSDANMNDSIEKPPIPSSKTSQAGSDTDIELMQLGQGNYLKPKIESDI